MDDKRCHPDQLHQVTNWSNKGSAPIWCNINPKPGHVRGSKTKTCAFGATRQFSPAFATRMRTKIPEWEIIKCGDLHADKKTLKLKRIMIKS